MVRFVVRFVRSVRPLARNPLKTLVRFVIRFVVWAFQKIRTVRRNPLKTHKRKIRSVFLRNPPIPPYACARERTRAARVMTWGKAALAEVTP